MWAVRTIIRTEGARKITRHPVLDHVGTNSSNQSRIWNQHISGLVADVCGWITLLGFVLVSMSVLSEFNLGVLLKRASENKGIFRRLLMYPLFTEDLKVTMPDLNLHPKM